MKLKKILYDVGLAVAVFAVIVTITIIAYTTLVPFDV